MGLISAWRAKIDLREARTRASLNAVRMRTRLAESVFDLYDNLVDPQKEFEGWLRLGDDRTFEKGPNSPVDLQFMRSAIREIVFNSGFAQNALDNLRNYIIGSGMTYEFRTPERVRVNDPSMADALDEIADDANAEWQRFSEKNDWDELEGDLVKTANRDGETCLRFFPGEILQVRYVDPASIAPPRSSTAIAPWGIEFAPNDAQRAIRYWIDDEGVDAYDVLFIALGCDPDVARGVPPFWPVRYHVVRVEKMIRHMAKLGEIQAAIAAVVERDDPIGSEAMQNMLNAAADKTPIDSESGKTVTQQKIREGSMLYLPAGQRFHFPTAGVGLDKFPPGIQAVLRAIAARFNMPEFMLTADASNANMASTFAATAPATKGFETGQAFFGRRFKRVHRRVLDNAIARGGLPEAAAALESEIHGPLVENRDPLASAQAREVDMRTGVLSVQTASAERGVNYDREQRYRAEHQVATGGLDQSLPDPNNVNPNDQPAPGQGQNNQPPASPKRGQPTPAKNAGG